MNKSIDFRRLKLPKTYRRNDPGCYLDPIRTKQISYSMIRDEYRDYVRRQGTVPCLFACSKKEGSII